MGRVALREEAPGVMTVPRHALLQWLHGAAVVVSERGPDTAG